MRVNPSFLPLTLFLCLCCASCETVQPQKAVVPVTPVPTEQKPTPVVVTQTVAQLPDPQPVPPESIPARPPIEYHPPVKEVETEPEPAQDPKLVRQPSKTSRPARRPPAEAPVPEAPPPVTATPPATEETVAPPKLSTADAATISKEQIVATLADVQRILADVAKRPRTAANQTTITRIRSFVRLSEQSTARNDLRQGDILAKRALALARDLVEPK
jgi:hypothetical protein